MKTNPLILMVTESSTSFDSFSRLFEPCGSQCQLLRVSNLLMAVARVAGGGVRSIVIDCSDLDSVNPESFAGLRESGGSGGSPSVSVVLWSDGRSAVESAWVEETGAAGWVTRHTSVAELKRLLGEGRPRLEVLEDKSRVSGRGGSSSARPVVMPRKGGPTPMPTRPAVISVMGAKGGIGTTTVAMNLAAGLAERGSVILAEIRPIPGDLRGYFRPGRMARGIENLGDADSAEVKSVLWPVPSVPGLRILFGPQTLEECDKLDVSRAVAIFDELSPEAEFIVLDFPFFVEPITRTLLGSSDYLAMVFEPTAMCMDRGKITLNGIRAWKKGPASIGAVMVKRLPEGLPLILPQLEAELEIPILRVVPPAGESCLISEQAHAPILQADPDSLVAESLLALARGFHARNGNVKVTQSWDIDYRGSLNGA